MNRLAELGAELYDVLLFTEYGGGAQIGDLLRGKADWAAVVAHYADYLVRHPKGPFRSEARFYLAEAIEKTKGSSETESEGASRWSSTSAALAAARAIGRIDLGQALLELVRVALRQAAGDDHGDDPAIAERLHAILRQGIEEGVFAPRPIPVAVRPKK